MAEVAKFLDQTIKISKKVQETAGKKLKDFEVALEKNDDIKKLAKDVEIFAS